MGICSFPPMVVCLKITGDFFKFNFSFARI
jgi:hypothetical protein